MLSLCRGKETRFHFHRTISNLLNHFFRFVILCFDNPCLEYVEHDFLSFVNVYNGQLEKGGGGNAPFSQYYKSIMEKAASRGLLMNEKVKSPNQFSTLHFDMSDDLQSYISEIIHELVCCGRNIRTGLSIL